MMAITLIRSTRMLIVILERPGLESSKSDDWKPRKKSACDGFELQFENKISNSSLIS